MQCQKTPNKRKGTTGATSTPSPSTGTAKDERLPFQELRGWRHPTTCSGWLSGMMVSVRISKIFQAPPPSSSVEGEGPKSNPYKLCIPHPYPTHPQTCHRLPLLARFPWAICSASQFSWATPSGYSWSNLALPSAHLTPLPVPLSHHPFHSW